jgi:glycosyltransferase involved in cell wall biosynthesis
MTDDVAALAQERIDAAQEAAPFVLATFFEGAETAGGVYVHRIGVLKVLRRLEQSANIKVLVICHTPATVRIVENVGLTAVLRRRSLFTNLAGFLSATRIVKTTFGRSWGYRISPWDRALTELGCDLVYFGGHDSRAAQLYQHNYIFTVFDLCHIEHPEFPEVAHFGEFERREHLFQTVLRKAVAIVTDSRAGRKLIARHYGVPISRIYAAPFLVDEAISRFTRDPATESAIRQQYGLTTPYVFYPAQFWQHKNHKYIIDALTIMLERFGWAPQAVFCGSDKGNLAPILRYAATMNVREHVKYCGFVPKEHLPHIYRGSLALVMPTYFGPTNIPPMEACAIGVPVCYSDTPAFREQLGDAAHYVDLRNPESLAQALQNIHSAATPHTDSHQTHWRAGLEGQEARYVHLLQEIIDRYRQKIPFRRAYR